MCREAFARTFVPSGPHGSARPYPRPSRVPGSVGTRLPARRGGVRGAGRWSGNPVLAGRPSSGTRPHRCRPSPVLVRNGPPRRRERKERPATTSRGHSPLSIDRTYLNISCTDSGQHDLASLGCSLRVIVLGSPGCCNLDQYSSAGRTALPVAPAS